MSTYTAVADVGLRVRSSPNIPASSEPDNKIGLLTYGQEVRVLQKKGYWSKIDYKSGGKSKTGWVWSQYLELTAKFLKNNTPNFVIGVPNRHDDFNTKIIRRFIADEFGGGRSKWDLQCTEYVFYKLKLNGIKIKWPVRSGRDGGKWGKIFRKFAMYSVSDTPTAGSAMCFTDGFKTAAAKNTGHIAYVEKVFSDGSIFVSEANVPNLGKYNERRLSPALWRDKFRGEFIDFTR